ncbi:MAG: glutamate racemase [Flavobacteriaceae bacterium]|nr:glutamate racemase [Flavobacteriaceae bacterium]
MNRLAPIGIFDSGVGGTSIWKEIHRLLPYERTMYLADSRNAPYGERKREEIIQLSKKNTELLLDAGCKLIVVACNTATTNAISELRATYDIPFIGIEPAIKPAALQTHTRSIGILATKGTLSSDLFHKTSELFANGIRITEVIGKGLVPLIEQGDLDSSELRELLQNYLQPMLDAKVDHIVLGCSHYPYLIPLMQELLPKEIKIIDSGAAVARQTKAVLEKNELLNLEDISATHQFYTNTSASTLQKLLQEFNESISIEVREF